MERESAIQLTLPTLSKEMGSNLRIILLDYSASEIGVVTIGDFEKVCNNIGSPLVIGHDEGNRTSLLMPHDVPINMESISSQFAEIGITVIDTNF